MTEEPVASRQARFRHMYELVEHGEFETYYPGDFSVCKGAIDLHVHCNWNRIDPVAQLKFATQAGMRALVFKIMQFPSVETARTASQTVQEWAEPMGLAPCEAFGGIVMGRPVGGLDLESLRYAIRAGARCVWFPTLTSANHFAKTRGSALNDAIEAGHDHLLQNGRLVAPARDVLRMAADAGMATSFGHASWPEIQELAEECQRIGYRGAMVDHPLNPVVGLSLDQISEVIRHGVRINFTAIDLQAFVGVAPKEFAEVLRTAGPDHVILSSDAGLRMMPDSVECMRQMVELLRLFEYSDQQIQQMVAGNAQEALGIAP